MKTYIELCKLVIMEPNWPLEGPIKSLTLEIEDALHKDGLGILCVDYCQTKIDSLQSWLNDVKLAQHREQAEREEEKRKEKK